MRLPNDKNKFSAQFKYVELARYVPDLNRVVREQTGPKDNRKSVLVEWDEVQAYAAKHNNTGIYTSIWQYKSPTITEGDNKLGNLYFDFDSHEVLESYDDTVRLQNALGEFGIPHDAIRIYFTGKKGFHVECEAVALGITPRSDLSDVFRFIATDLKQSLGLRTLDFAVYDERRIWRLPYTRHQLTNLFKCELPDEIIAGGIDGILRFAEDPVPVAVPEQFFSYQANEWYREYTYKIIEQEKPQYTTQDLIDRFNKHGSRVVKNIDAEREFDPVSLFEGCHAILDWWKYAEEKHDLPHEARLFLCSILTYSDEAIWYLHEILKNCDDYNWEKSQSHINDWIKRREMGIGGRPYTCTRANAANVGCGDCHLEPKKKWVEINGTLVEMEEEAQPSPVRFAYHRP